MENKQKNIFLFAGFLVLLLLVYYLAIANTLNYKSKYKEQTKEIQLLDNAANKIKVLQQKNSYLDSILNAQNISINNSFQQTLLQKITNYSKKEKVDIIAFNEPHKVLLKENNELTYSFELKGNFVALLRVLHKIEKEGLGEIISVNYEKRKNYKRNTNYLLMSVYLRKIES